MSIAQSPLFEPVLWQDGGFKILDEILLPDAVSYIEVSAVSQAIDAVRDMKTRAFGQVLTFLYSGALVAQNHVQDDVDALRCRVAEMTQQFCAARPTFDFAGCKNYPPACRLERQSPNKLESSAGRSFVAGWCERNWQRRFCRIRQGC
jgi:hypothetical protein